MESFNYSCAQLSFATDHQFPHYNQYQEEVKTAGKMPPPAAAYRAPLHSVRKFPARNVITKKPIAPLPPTPPKVYKVDPVDFKDVVQKLTGAPEFLPTRLQEVAPPPLDVSPPLQNNLGVNGEEEKPRKLGYDAFGALSPLGFTLSPASIAWCSTVLMSPGTIASLEPSAVV